MPETESIALEVLSLPNSAGNPSHPDPDVSSSSTDPGVDEASTPSDPCPTITTNEATVELINLKARLRRLPEVVAYITMCTALLSLVLTIIFGATSWVTQLRGNELASAGNNVASIDAAIARYSFCADHDVNVTLQKR